MPARPVRNSGFFGLVSTAFSNLVSNSTLACKGFFNALILLIVLFNCCISNLSTTSKFLNAVGFSFTYARYASASAKVLNLVSLKKFAITFF